MCEMTLLYIYPGDLNKSKASVYQSRQQIESFALKCDVICVSFGDARNNIDVVHKVFKSTLLYYFEALKVGKKANVVYSRSPLMLLPFIIGKKKLALELHSNPADHKFIYRVAFSLLKKIPKVHVITITESLAKDLDGVSVRLVAPDSALIVADVKPNSVKSRLVLGYIGGYSEGKGLDTLADLSLRLDYSRFELIVAGLSRDLALELGYCFHKNVDFFGYVERSDLDSFMSRIDIGLVPNKARVYGSGDEFVNIGKYTSPMKLFEYMAYRKLIVASDLDVLKEVLCDDNAFFFCPGDENSLLKVLDDIAINRAESFYKEATAYRDFLVKYSQEVRTKNILSILC